MEFKDYYQTLGVARDATAEQIKKVYRSLARKYHPDVSKEADAERRMKEINEAYAVLSDPEKRAAYDALLARGHRAGEAFRPPPDWDAGFEFSGRGFDDATAADFSDFFAELFGRMGGRRSRAHFDSDFGARGEDHYAKVLLDLEDAWRGAKRTITLRVPTVDAAGRVRLRDRTLEVQIPRGVREGQLIRLAGQGAPGTAGAPPGDLFLEVHFAPHPRWRVEGKDIVADLPVAPWEAALGAVIPVELPDGSTLRVRIPAGAQSGRRLTVRGRGLPSAEPGDLDLVIRVVLPSADDPRARRLYEAMARELPDFDARRAASAQPSEQP